MENLGKKQASMYDHPDSPKEKDKIIYPSVRLPIEIIKDKNIDLNSDVTLTLKGKVIGLTNNKWEKTVEVELHSGEIKAENKSVLDS